MANRKLSETAWRKMAAEYAAGRGTYRELARKHRVSAHTVEGRARREKWGDARRKTQEEIRQKTALALVEGAADQARESGREVYRELLDMTGTLKGAGGKLLAELDRVIDQKCQGADLGEGMTLNNLVDAYDKLTKALRLVHDQTTANLGVTDPAAWAEFVAARELEEDGLLDGTFDIGKARADDHDSGQHEGAAG